MAGTCSKYGRRPQVLYGQLRPRKSHMVSLKWDMKIFLSHKCQIFLSVTRSGRKTLRKNEWRKQQLREMEAASFENETIAKRGVRRRNHKGSCIFAIQIIICSYCGRLCRHNTGRASHERSCPARRCLAKHTPLDIRLLQTCLLRWKVPK